MKIPVNHFLNKRSFIYIKGICTGTVHSKQTKGHYLLLWPVHYLGTIFEVLIMFKDLLKLEAMIMLEVMTMAKILIMLEFMIRGHHYYVMVIIM